MELTFINPPAGSMAHVRFGCSATLASARKIWEGDVVQSAVRTELFRRCHNALHETQV